MAKGVIVPPPARYLDPNDKPTVITHLWELNRDCLDKLCAYLTNDDMKYLAQSNIVFGNIVSKNLYDRLLTNQMETVYVDYGSNKDDILHFPTTKHIHVTHETLQLCGKYVKKLHLTVRDQAAISALIKHCPNVEELLIEGVFNNSSGSSLFCEPLKSLKKLEFIRGELSHTMTQFNDWCPNLNYLKFGMIYNIADRDCIDVHFLHLKQFVIGSACPFTTKNIKLMLQKNPQIEVLQIDWPQFDGESFDFLCGKLESLEKLKLRLNRDFEPAFSQNDLHAFKRVKEVEIDCWYHWSSALLLVSKYFPNINTLTVKLLDGNQILTPLDDIHSIDVMSNLKKLILSFDVPRDEQLELLLRFSSKMPNLSKLDMRSNMRSSDPLNQCFAYFAQLQALSLSGRIVGNGNPVFDANFHRKFNRIVGDRHAAKIDIDVEAFRGARYNVNKQYIHRNRRIICTNLSFKKIV